MHGNFYTHYRRSLKVIATLINYAGIILRIIGRAVATGQVFRYLPDHFFSKLPERLPVSIVQKWAEHVVIEFDDRTSQLDCKCLTFTPSECTRNALR